MITFKIGFLLAFSLFPKSSAKNKSVPKDSAKSKKSRKSVNSKKSKKSSSKSSNNSSRKSKRKKESVILPKYVLDVGEPIGYARIEYELFPDRKQKQTIDVICWKGVARVYAGENFLTYRVRIVNDKVWIPIYVQNIVNQLNVDELQRLHGQEIDFTINTTRNKLGIKAKSVKTKLFFMKIEDASLTDVTVPVFTDNPNLPDNSEASSTTYFREIIKDCIYRPGEKNWNEIIVKVNMSDTIYTRQMNKVIDAISEDSELYFKEFIPVSLPPETSVEDLPEEKKKEKPKKEKVVKQNDGKKGKKKKGENKKGKKLKTTKKKDKSIQATVLDIKVSGEIFFTDPTLSIYSAKTTTAIISNAYVLLSVENLMTLNQIYFLNPMIVKIDKIVNLDMELLKSKKFKSIFVRYHVPYVARGKTLERDIAEKIWYGEAHAHFVDKIPEIKLVEFLQSKRFTFEICGVREENIEPEIYPSIFGSDENDQYFDRKMTLDRYILNLQNNSEDTNNPTEVLAVATYDLTPLLLPIWKCDFYETCHNPDNFQKDRLGESCFHEVIRTNNVNLKVLFKENSKSPFTECSLIEKGMSLKVQVLFGAPITSRTKNILFRQQYYNRMLLVMSSNSIASSLLSEILIRNQELNLNVVVPNLYDNFEPYDVEFYLSGFVIDNGNTYVFFLEGLNREVEKVWTKYMNSSLADMRIYYNSEYVFEERLYGQFLKLRGFCIITLQKPLRDILSQEMFYIEGHVPLPCWEAIKKLDLLFRSTTLKDILQYNLLPTPDELLSLHLEFGTAIRWNENLYKSCLLVLK